MPTPRHAARPLVLSTMIVLSVLAVGGLATGSPSSALGPVDAGTAVTAQQTQPGSRLVFAPSVFRDIGGQVATEDGEVSVRGRATGFEEVLVTLIDQRGRIASEVVTVDDDDVFEEDVALVTPQGTSLGEGPIVATVFAPGRDGVVGDGEIAGFTRADLAALDASTRQRLARERANQSVTRTQQQVLQLFYEESINDSGSDDLALFDVFRYTDGRTQIDAVRSAVAPNLTGIDAVAPNETMVVRGRTNRKPDDNTIIVEVTDGPSADAFDVAATDTWGPLGVWRVAIDVPPDAEPGTYTLRADDGDDTDTVRVEVRAAGDGTATNETATGTS